MAGGVGSRFWPMSNVEKPKQFLDVLGCGETLLQSTYARFKDLFLPENVWITTCEAYVPFIKEQLPEIHSENIICEPIRRNTAPSIAYASWKIKSINSKANVVVTPSDHVIKNLDLFHKAILNSLDFSSETDSIITIGIKPTNPETNYGYIEADLSYASSRKENIFRVDSFIEKPSKENAEDFITHDNFFWNSGIYVWNNRTIINAFRVYQPSMAEKLDSMIPYFNTDKESVYIKQYYPDFKDISIDYSITENSEELYIYPSTFAWTDLGSWHSLRHCAEKDIYGNARIGKNIQTYESNNCMILSSNLKNVIVQGLDDYIIAEKDGILLICKLTEENRIALFH